MGCLCTKLTPTTEEAEAAGSDDRKSKRRVHTAKSGESVKDSAGNGNHDQIKNGMKTEETGETVLGELRWIKDYFPAPEPIDTEDNDENWERVAKTKLERDFDKAVRFMGSAKGFELASRISKDETVKLYGLYRIATEEPSSDPQSKRDAWPQIGNLTCNEAMQQYIGLVSTNSPGWMQHDSDDHQ